MQLFQEIMKLGNSDNLKTIIFIITSFLKTFGSTGFLSGQSNPGVRRLKSNVWCMECWSFLPILCTFASCCTTKYNFIRKAVVLHLHEGPVLGHY